YLRNPRHGGQLEAVNSDGLIEALRGSEAQIDLVATEPLQSADLLVGSERVPTQATADPAIRRATMKIERDAPCSIELVSLEGARGKGPQPARARAIPDAMPAARWLVPPDVSTQLRPQDTAEFAYEAFDDDALVSLRATVQSSAQQTAIDLPVQGDGARGT